MPPARPSAADPPGSNSTTNPSRAVHLARPWFVLLPPAGRPAPLAVFINTLPAMKTNLTQAFASFSEHWSPRIAADLNGQQLKLVKFQGAFDWHFHEHEDELFLVHRGSFTMEFRDKRVELHAGEFLVVPRGIEHRPVAEHEVEVLLFEPASTLNTGNITSARTVPAPKRVAT